MKRQFNGQREPLTLKLIARCTAIVPALSAPRLTHFDRAVIVVMLAADRADRRDDSARRPGGRADQPGRAARQAHSTSPITIRFSEAMDHDSVTAHFHTEPALQGTFSWSGATLNFHPTQALEPGNQYTVYLEPGAQSESGRALLAEYRYSFTVVQPRIAYLYPADGDAAKHLDRRSRRSRSSAADHDSPTGHLRFQRQPGRNADRLLGEQHGCWRRATSS